MMSVIRYLFRGKVSMNLPLMMIYVAMTVFRHPLRHFYSVIGHCLAFSFS